MTKRGKASTSYGSASTRDNRVFDARYVFLLAPLTYSLAFCFAMLAPFLGLLTHFAHSWEG